MRSWGGSLAFTLVLGAVVSLLISCGRDDNNSEDAKPAPVTEASTSALSLPSSAFHVEWTHVEAPATMAAGKVVSIAVTFKNTSPNAWPDPKHAGAAKPDGSHAVRLAYRWWKRDRPMPESEYGTRTDLTTPLEPGQSATLVIPVRAPLKPGDYNLQLDLVEELVTWFEGKGVPKELIPVKVF